MGNIQSFSKSYQMYLSFFSFIDEKTYDYDVIPVLLFQRLVYKGELLGNNVYALGVYKENNNLGGWSKYNLNSYGDFEEVPSKSWHASRSGKIPFRKYSTRLKSQNIFLVKLYNLKNGIYALRREIDWNKYEYSFFELE